METVHDIATVLVLLNILALLYGITELNFDIFIWSVVALFFTASFAAFTIPGDDKPHRYGGGLPF